MKVSVGTTQNSNNEIGNGNKKIELKGISRSVLVEYVKNYMKDYIFGLFTEIGQFAYVKVVNEIIGNVDIKALTEDINNQSTRNIFADSIYCNVRMVVQELNEQYPDCEDFTIEKNSIDMLIHEVHLLINQK
jgi:hypothetical protein